jgi:hypothetical protein
VIEPVIGLSHARNRAVREARGEYMLWIDDDVLVSRDWLCAYCRALRAWPEASVFGGPIEPHWEGAPPEWLIRVLGRVSGALSLCDLGSEPIELSADSGGLPFGANYAVRRAEQLRFVYDPALGPSAAHPHLRGDETQLMRAMLRAGCLGRWVPGARVRHLVPAERQTVRYLRSVYTGLGQTYARLAAHESVRTLLGRPRWALRRAVLSELRYRARRKYAPPEVWIEDLIAASLARGYLRRVAPQDRCASGNAAPERRGET